MPCRPFWRPPDPYLLPGSSTCCVYRRADCVMTSPALLALMLAGVVTASEVTTTPSPAIRSDSIWVLIVIIAIPFVCCVLCLCSTDDEGDPECCWFPKTLSPALFGSPQRGCSRGRGGAQVSGASEDLRIRMLGTGGAQEDWALPPAADRTRASADLPRPNQDGAQGVEVAEQ